MMIFRPGEWKKVESKPPLISEPYLLYNSFADKYFIARDKTENGNTIVEYLSPVASYFPHTSEWSSSVLALQGFRTKEHAIGILAEIKARNKEHQTALDDRAKFLESFSCVDTDE